MSRRVEFFDVEILGERGAISQEVGFDDLFNNFGPLPRGGDDGDGSVVVQLILE